MTQVGAIWKEAAQTSAGFEPYAQQLRDTFHKAPQMLEQIILGLFEIGYADHDLSEPELKYIKKVSQIFGIDQATFSRLRNSRPEFVKEDPYKVRILTLRSFGESLYHSITDSSLEFGYKAV